MQAQHSFIQPGQAAQVTLTSEVVCNFLDGSRAIALAQVQVSDILYVLVLLDDSAMTFAGDCKLGDTFTVIPCLPSDEAEAELVHQQVREYRWDWNLTPDCGTLLAVLQESFSAVGV